MTTSNSLLTSQPISQLAIELLRRSLVLVATVSRIPGDEYAGPSGGTVTLRVPQPRTAREQSTPGESITYDNVEEEKVDVSLVHLYDAALVTDEDLSLTIESFGSQVLYPQVESIARAAEDQLADVMNGLTADDTIEWAHSADPDDDRQTVLAIREQLTKNDVPAGKRYVAIAPDICTRLLSIPEFVRANERGNPSALEDAIVGHVYGLTFLESNAIDAGTSVAYHQSGFAWGNRPPVAPGGGADSATATEGGVSLRHVLAFDVSHLSTASVVSVFAGAAVVLENGDPMSPLIERAIKVDTASS
jgi:hypothetical protein